MRIRFFAQLREIAGTDSVEIDVGALDAAGLWDFLGSRWPALSAYRSTTRLARNGTYSSDEEVFASGDEVALIPPVSGG